MKKLLLIGTNTIHVLNYFNLIKESFDEVLLITDEKNEKLDYGDLKIQYTNFSIHKPLEFYKSIGFIKKLIKEFNPTIIHSHQITTNSFLTLLANKKIQKPIVITAWGSDVLSTPNKGFAYKWMVKYILKNTNYFTADAQYMADVMCQLAGKSLKILIANFGINIDNQEKSPKENIIYSNRQLKKLYRIDKIIKAFSLFVGKDNPENWKLIIGAVGEEMESLTELSKSLGISQFVEFVGWLDKSQNSKYYQISKYYISIPESDGTSISLLEAMAAGCLPILSNLPANREWIEHKKNGIIVSDLDSNFIQEADEMDLEKAKEINLDIILSKGTKEANRLKFMELYLNAIHNN